MALLIGHYNIQCMITISASAIYPACIDFAKHVEIQRSLLSFETIELIIHMCSYEDTSLTLRVYVYMP